MSWQPPPAIATTVSPYSFTAVVQALFALGLCNSAAKVYSMVVQSNVTIRKALLLPPKKAVVWESSYSRNNVNLQTGWRGHFCQIKNTWTTHWPITFSLL